MKRQYRSGSERAAAAIALAQIKTLIVSLNRGVQLLETEIATEEERSRCKDQRDPAYSILARGLIVRGDNLTTTIRALQERGVPIEGLTSSRVAEDELLPA
jgi:hypothetical protein